MYQDLRIPWTAPVQPAFQPTLYGPLQLVTPASGQAVSTDDAKAHCRIDLDTEDAIISALVQRATAYCESEAGGRQVLAATWDLPMAAFCLWDRPITLPRPPLQSVQQVTYFDADGTLQTLDPSLYLVTTPWKQPGTLERAPYQWWPACQGDRRYPVTICFTAGYAPGQVPGEIQQAILMLVEFWYRNRSAAGPVAKEVDFAVHALLETQGWGAYA